MKKLVSAGIAFTARYPEAYAEAAEYCRPFIENLAGLLNIQPPFNYRYICGFNVIAV